MCEVNLIGSEVGQMTGSRENGTECAGGMNCWRSVCSDNKISALVQLLGDIACKAACVNGSA